MAFALRGAGRLTHYIREVNRDIVNVLAKRAGEDAFGLNGDYCAEARFPSNADGQFQRPADMYHDVSAELVNIHRQNPYDVPVEFRDGDGVYPRFHHDTQLRRGDSVKGNSLYHAQYSEDVHRVVRSTEADGRGLRKPTAN